MLELRKIYKCAIDSNDKLTTYSSRNNIVFKVDGLSKTVYLTKEQTINLIESILKYWKDNDS